MVNPTAGWALEASAVLSTRTGGTLWLNVTPPGVAVMQDSMAVALDARTAWVTARRNGSQATVVAHTTDGGHTWHTYQLALPVDATGIGGITFVDARHGWLLASLGAGAGSEGVQILRTADGGAHWATVSRTARPHPAPGSLPLWGIKTGLSFRDASTGWATAAVAGPDNFSWLYMTRDAGHTWQHQGLAFPAPYRQVVPVLAPPRFFTARDGVLPVILNTPAVPPAIDFYATRDGGASWSSTTPLPYTHTAGSPIWDFGDRDHGWAFWGTQLQRTTDGGRHWSVLAPDPGLRGTTQVDFVNAQVGWALGTATASSSPLLRTTDGGRTWSRLSSYLTYPPDGGVHIQATGR